jgi:hypothetical protein
VIALGVAWVLDGLEVTLVRSVGSVLERDDKLALTATQVGWAGSLYVGSAPALFGALIAAGSRINVFTGYALGAALVLLAALVAWRWGVNGERKPMEVVAAPLGADAAR